MASAKSGDTVRVHYTGRLEDGSVFDTSEGRDPLEFTLGGGEVIAGFDEAVTGMEEGERRSAHIAADDGYGVRREELVLEMPREQIPDDLDLEVGMMLELHRQDGNAVPVTVTDLGDVNVTLDANHPLAGEDLTFEVELVSIEPANP